MRPLRHKAGCANFAFSVRRPAVTAPAAFTLIELLVVLALMVVIITVYWGSGSPNYQQRQTKLCALNLQKIDVAMEIYARENGDRFPETPGARTSEEALDALVPRYTADTAIFICPGSKDSALPAGESFRKRKISYAYYMGRRLADAGEILLSDRQTDTLPKSAGQLAFSTTGKPPGNNHARFGGNFLFCDGHVESTPAAIPFSISLAQNIVLLNPKP